MLLYGHCVVMVLLLIVDHSVMDYSAAIHIIDCFLIDGSKVCIEYIFVSMTITVIGLYVAWYEIFYILHTYHNYCIPKISRYDYYCDMLLFACKNDSGSMNDYQCTS